jgi:KDO2-lipid IV(A) lauroyltransferase
LRATARRVYAHFGRVAATLAVLAQLKAKKADRWVFVENEHLVDEALAQGKGCLVVSGHLGNWEIGGAYTATKGYPSTFVVTTQRNKLTEQMLNRIREKAGVEIIKRRDAVRGVLSALKRNRIVAILIDQDAHEDGAFVPFFGRLASTPRGPAVFHLRTGAPLLFVSNIRLPGERYRIRYSAVDTSGTDDADELTARLTAQLESEIRETPEQWFWMHRRWKSSPPVH